MMIHQNIRYLREEILGMTIKFMAKTIGYTNTAIKYWEAGQSRPAKRAQMELVRFFNKRIPKLNLTITRLNQENLSQNREIRVLFSYKYLREEEEDKEEILA